ncbi:putative Nucleotidyltransferase/DNA polymerase involved in DNA repair [Vibrio nigripulchritudo SO65]|uniref:Y-family DNA polymerase n=1 Tax=Vibrio nigripulchritudo TaxID=28173 RepID=UPI0003B201E9|nr:DNA polymerase Y family protein [Vibrio nigripulchritudo]CCN36884.1 putative Nucleotidyltransferase/DNA polymerase involved in DNA repair [Vibrio nigripulchritudo AM115]CCN42555.1 putative Nucleotidyltransferase/DNA polymerase involved in DNA repair [Vibrio nigripulchritudo FTn2]CCN63863.1 putative Nucleotidyltransferase/DNA polymerase involved in DNA repair [Vibrio nigripulchritudo POn4]CCN74736.1 putative Nucleotidyltransferase/DNA polymerase involved in DNA repair [Vibrio nigripulchritudo
MLWLYLHFPSLQLDSCFFDSDLENNIAIVDEHHQIIQLSKSGFDAGLKLNMGLGTAASLCQDLQVYPYDIDIEHKKLKEIAQWLYLITSDITLCEPNGILLKISNMLCLYSNLEHYWLTVQQHLKKFNVRYQFSTGFSPYSAQILAQQKKQFITDDSDLMKKHLYTLPLGVSDLSEKVVDKLSRVGIETFDALFTIPMADIAKRFDIDLINYIGKLTGRFKHPVDFYHPPQTFKYSLDLLYEIENIQFLERPLGNLLKKLEHFLKLRDQLANEIQIILQLRNKQNTEFKICSAQGEYLASKWLSLSQLTFESLSIDSPVVAITLSVTRITQQEGSYTDLFEGKQGTTNALELMSLLHAKLGERALHNPGLLEDPRPEIAYQYTSPNTALSPTLSIPPKLRPAILLPHPKPLEEKVTLSLGPERVATGWWDNQPMVRDYFIAHTNEGRWLWVFRTPKQQWFLHGVFS